MLIIDANNEPRPFGPFDVDDLLIKPDLSRRILPLERFILRHGNSGIGLDSLDKEQNPRATAMISSGLQWKGIIYFSDKNKDELSPQGMNLLFQFANATGQRPRSTIWNTGFYVEVRGRYYRHSFESDQESGEVELFIDITPTPGVGKERRFHVKKGSPSFFEDSLNSLAQAQVIRAMELVNQKYGGSLRVKSKTVKWYAGGYKQLYPKMRAERQTLPRSISIRNSTTILRDIYSCLATQINSSSFCNILTQNKRLITLANLNTFKKEVQSILEHVDEVRGHWGEMMITKRVAQPNAANVDPSNFGDDENPIQDEPDARTREVPNQPNDNQQVDLDEYIPEDVIMIDDEETEETAPDYEVKTDDTTTLLWDGTTGSSPVVEMMEESPSSRAGYSRPDQESIKLLPLLPRYMLDSPKIPPSCRWRCPAKGCSFVLDLKGHLSIEYLKALTPDEIRFLQQRLWTSKTPEAHDIFCRMVGKHFEHHVQQLGLRFVNDQLRRA